MRGAIIAITVWSLPLLVSIALALPPALRKRSWARFFIALGLSFVGTVVPLLIFVLSAFLVPDWKGACRFGWLDCFHCGKLALTPFVLWASAALYAVEVLRIQDPGRCWIRHGVFLGAVISTVCLVVGVMTARRELAAFLVVPSYVSVWYVYRSSRLIKDSGVEPFRYGVSFLSTLPFWVASVILSRRCYLALPDQHPSCFIVTAAMRGHEQVVGPFFIVTRCGLQRKVNQQLVTLWRLERAWTRCSPGSHSAFRKVYNTVGPVLARQISSPLGADVIYLAVKPVEFLGRLVVKCENKGDKQ